MFFLTFNSANIWFVKKKLVWKTYNITKALPMTKRVEIIFKKEFRVAVLNENNKTFIIHITIINTNSNIHFF